MKVFIDIETVPRHFTMIAHENPDFYLFKNKFRSETKDMSVTQICELYLEKAALFAEFGKIVCVSMGYVQNEKIVLKSFCSDDEKQILSNVAMNIDKASSLVAHNGKDFDYPWLCRRMITHGVPLPALLQIQNLKPWEIRLEDTVDMWKFGQFSHKASLALMCSLFGLPSPKDGMDGSKVAEVFYVEKDYQKIASYCEGDVAALINVYRKMNYQSLI